MSRGFLDLLFQPLKRCLCLPDGRLHLCREKLLPVGLPFKGISESADLVIRHEHVPFNDLLPGNFSQQSHQLSGSIMEFHTGNLSVYFFIGNGFMVPGKSGPIDHSGHGKFRMGNMAEIPPVRIQHANGVVLLCIVAHSDYVLIGIFNMSHPVVPTGNTRTEILLHAGLGHFTGGLIGLVGCVAPGKTNHVFGQLLYQLRLPADHISPEHRLLALFHQKFTELLNIVDINPVYSFFVRKGLCLSFSKVKGLVAAEVKLVCGKQRHIFLQHPLDQRQCPFIPHIDGMVAHPVNIGKGLLPGIFHLAQLSAGFGGKQGVEMAKA